MLLYRACNHIEASYQKIGEPRVSPPSHLLSKEWLKDGENLYMTMFPEVWRRHQNGAYDFLYFYWDHTLLLEVPDEKLIKITEGHGLAGMEYKLTRPEDAIVRGIAGPEWSSLPDWVPQPKDEKDWDPTSTNWEHASHIFYWVPRGVDPKTVWYHPTQPSQRKLFREHMLRLRMEQMFGGLVESAKQIGLVCQYNAHKIVIK